MILTTEQLNILNHVVEDGQVWADAASEEAMLKKVARWKPDYETALAKGNYKTRKQRDDADAEAEQDRYDNVSWDQKRMREYPHLQECIHAILDDELDALQAKRKLVKDKYPKE